MSRLARASEATSRDWVPFLMVTNLGVRALFSPAITAWAWFAPAFVSGLVVGIKQHRYGRREPVGGPDEYQ